MACSMSIAAEFVFADLRKMGGVRVRALLNRGRKFKATNNFGWWGLLRTV